MRTCCIVRHVLFAVRGLWEWRSRKKDAPLGIIGKMGQPGNIILENCFGKQEKCRIKTEDYIFVVVNGICV